MSDYGKKFEQQFKKDWLNSFPNTFLFRLPDQQSGYKTTSKNPCDFICYTGKNLYLIECKAHAGNTIPFVNLRQHDLLKSYEHCAITGYVCWFYDNDEVFFITTQIISQMMNEGKKSINRKDSITYNFIKIPSIKKRTFMTSNYNILENS